MDILNNEYELYYIPLGQIHTPSCLIELLGHEPLVTALYVMVYHAPLVTLLYVIVISWTVSQNVARQGYIVNSWLQNCTSWLYHEPLVKVLYVMVMS